MKVELLKNVRIAPPGGVGILQRCVHILAMWKFISPLAFSCQLSMQIKASSHGFPRGMRLPFFEKTDPYFDFADKINAMLVLRKNLLHLIRSWQPFSLLPGPLLDEHQNNPLHRLLFLRLLCPVCVEVSEGLAWLCIFESMLRVHAV